MNNDYTMMNIFWRMLKFSKRYWFAGLLIFALMSVEIFFTLGFAFVNEKALNHIQLNEQSEFVYMLQVAALVGFACIILLFVQDFLKEYIPSLVTRDLALQIFTKINSLPLVKLFPFHTGDQVTRIKNDSKKSVGIIGNSVYSLVYNILLALVAFSYLATISWPLALLIVCSGPVTLVLGRVFDKRMRKLSTEEQNKEAEIKSFTQEYLQGMTTVRAYSLDQLMSEEYKKKRLEYNSLSIRRTLTNQSMWVLLGLTNKILFITVFFIICLLTLKGQLDIGSSIAFFILMNRVQAPFMALSGTWGDLQDAFGASKRIYDILDVDEKSTQSGNLLLKYEINQNQTILEMENVSFQYPSIGKEKSIPAISNVSLTLQKGERIAIVGSSGAGKTTLAKLICGLYDLNTGEINLFDNGHNSLETSLLDHVSYVPQNTYVFSGTIYENISFANQSASKEEVLRAAKSARIHDDILLLKDGYETMVGEKGLTLSGGQRQRLTIARAFLKPSSILVLDEATSALDLENEMLVYEAMDQLMLQKTVVVIAHRLSTIKQTDKIIVLNQGTKVEEGKHEQLMSIKGYYYDLVQSRYI